MSSPAPGLRQELLDDFYAECDELLTSSREALVLVEKHLGDSSAARPRLESLFRHLHSIKGNCAIVGLKSGEELAHAMEDLLRKLAKGEQAVSAPMIDTLLAQLQRLEEIVTAHRLAKPLPDIAEALVEIRRFVGPSVTAGERKTSAPPFEPAAGEKRSWEDQARARGLHPWLCRFTPSPELDKRGVNVASVRARLGAIGEILKAVPLVRDKTIQFEFFIGLREKQPGDAMVQHEGLQFEAIASTGPERPVEHEAGISPSDALSLAPSHLVRVDLGRLDELMRILGELVVHRSRLNERIGQLATDTSALREVDSGLARSLRDMREAVARVRLVPVAEIFARMPFVVRELSRASDKQVRVVLEGHQTDVDKFIAERLKEPLLHLVRNAFAHGIESPAAREAAGKSAEATIVLGATSSGDSVVISIRDDGRGIDPQVVAERAKALGWTVPDELDDAALLALLCQPGFSTQRKTDLAAGRGVGMAVVATTVRELGGRLSLQSWPGRGTEFTLRLPLTLSIVDALVIRVGEQFCAVPQRAVAEIVQAESATLRTINRTECTPYRDGVLPLSWLRTIFRLEAKRAGLLTIVVLRGERGVAGLVVDAVSSHREIVVRPLVDPLLHVPGIAGVTELGDGRPILILDPISITSGAVRPGRDLAAETSLTAERFAS